MTVGFAQKNVFTKALLTLFIDGKSITDKDVHEPLNALELVQDLDDLVEEVYLLSMYHHLAPLQDLTKLEKALDEIEIRLDELDLDTFKDALVYKKYAFGKVLCGSKTFVGRETRKFNKVENLSSLEELSQLGSLSLFIGIMLKDPAEFEEGCQIAELIDAFMKEDGEVDALFLHRGGDYSKDACRVSIFVLMSLYECVTKNSLSVSKVNKLDPFEGGLFQTLDVESRLLCRVLETATTLAHSIEKREAKSGSLDGLIQIGSEGFKYRSIEETKVGIGSVSYKDQLIIPSFGPHILPLGKNDTYGLSPPVCAESEVNVSTCSMWNRVKSDTDYGNHWIHSKVEPSENTLSIESFIWSEKKEEKLSLVFFVRGTAVETEEKRYLSGGLERAFVHTSKIDLVTGGSKMQILTKEAMDVEIIPLAGGEFFFNSDFILSFPFRLDRPLGIDFVMD